MKLFLDTSSLVKMYHEEAGSDGLSDFIDQNAVENLFLAEITKIEFLSAVWKKCRTKELSVSNGSDLISTFQSEINFDFIEETRFQKRVASELITIYWKEGLRTLDAIQLASVLSIKDQIDFFISSDKTLCEVAEKEGLKTKLIN